MSSVEVKHVDLPPDMQRAMARQAEAEREKRAKIIHAAGELEASEKLAQAAGVIATEPVSITLRYLQTLTEIASEKNSTIIFPLPIELINLIGSRTEQGVGVPELTHDTAEDGFHEIQLSGKQLVFLVMTVTIVSVVIFLCGVLVGRDTRPTAARPTLPRRAAATPPAAADDRCRGPTRRPNRRRLRPKTELDVPRATAGEAPQAEELKPKAGGRQRSAKPAPPPPAAQRRSAPPTCRPGPARHLVRPGDRAYATGPRRPRSCSACSARGIRRTCRCPRAAIRSPLPRARRALQRPREAEQVARRLKEDQLTAEVRR